MGYKLKRIMMWVRKTRGLPAEYQEVEYIQSSNTQYINTGVINQWTTLSVDMKFIITQTNSSSAEDGLFGAKGSSTQSPTIYLQSNSNKSLGSWCGSGTGYTISNTISLNKLHTLTVNYSSSGRTGVYDGTSFSSTMSISNSANNTSGYMCFFSDGSTPVNKCYMKLYSAKITVNGTLVRNLIPCYRKSDSVIGLYDLVNNQFYTNSGSGTFTKGTDVPDMVEKQVYPVGWNPGANTIGYWTFDDQNTDQITDVSGNNNNLIYTEGNKITYSLLSGTDYYGNFNKSKYAATITGISSYTLLMYIRLDQTGSQYIMNNIGIDLIYGFNSGQIEVYDYYGGSTYRSTIKSNTPLNTRMLIGFTKNGSTVTTYYNGSKVGTATFANYQFTYVGMGGSVSQGFKGSADRLILENKVRTDQEFSDYYNLTKSNYGL